MHGSAMLRISLLAIGLFVVSDVASAQDPEGAAMSTASTASVKPSLEEEYAALRKVNGDLERKILALEKSNRDLETSAHQLKQTVLMTKTAGKRLSLNLARRISRNVSRQVAGMAGTSIPYLGAGVSVAMTALDVKDGCESLRELNEMNHTMKLETEDESPVCAIQVPTKEDVVAQVINNWRAAYGQAAAWANQSETRLPPDPPNVSYARAAELWMAVFGSIPKPGFQTSPMCPTLPTLPTLPTVPTIKR